MNSLIILVEKNWRVIVILIKMTIQYQFYHQSELFFL